MSSKAAAVLFLTALTSALSAQTIYNNAAPGIATQTLSPSGVFDFVGTNLCSTSAAFEIMTPGTIPTSMSGCTLTIDGVPAPLLYVSANKITFIALNSGSVVSAGGQSVNVTYTASTPRFVKSYLTNGVGIPILQACNSTTLQGSEQNPITFEKNNPGGNCLIASLSGAGQTIDASTGPVPPGTIGYGYCAALPKIAIDGVQVVFINTLNGLGQSVPYCKQGNAFTLAGFEIPSALSPHKQHLLTVEGTDGIVETSVIY